MSLLLTAVAALWSQTAPPLNVQIPEVPAATADATCGGRPALAQQAFCLVTTQIAAEEVVTALTADFERQGWLAADGRDNLVVYIRRKDGGGCDAFQMYAFADGQQSGAPGSRAYLALAAIPGDICTARPPAQ